MPTANLFVYLLLVGAVYLYRVSYSGWFGLYLLLAVITVPLLLALLSLPSALTMTLTAESAASVTKGRPCAARLRFTCRGGMPVGRVRVRLQCVNRFTGETERSVHTWYGVATQSQPLALPTDQCGQLVLRVEQWECRDLLGFFSLRRRNPEPAMCTVVPSVREPDEGVDFEATLSSAAQLRPKYGGGFSEEHDLREYRPGDMANSIHWKLSSKTDSLIVREALEQENSEVFAVLSRVGRDDRGLETLYWLSLELLKREQAHILVADRLYPVGNEEECLAALMSLLSAPMGEPCGFDPQRARAIFRVSGGEVASL